MDDNECRKNVKQFYEALKADPPLVEKLKAAFIAAKPETKESALTFVADFAAENGFAFSTDEIRPFEQEARELSADELNATNAAVGHGFGACGMVGIGFGVGLVNDESGGYGAGLTGCFVVGLGLGAWADWEKKGK